MNTSILLFPSTLIHEVKPPKVGGMISSDDTDVYADRISLSFNVFPTGRLGDSSDLNELRIQ